MWKYNLTYVGSAEQHAPHLRQNGVIKFASKGDPLRVYSFFFKAKVRNGVRLGFWG